MYTFDMLPHFVEFDPVGFVIGALLEVTFILTLAFFKMLVVGLQRDEMLWFKKTLFHQQSQGYSQKLITFMDFFDDDFGLSESSPRKQHQSKPPIPKKSSTSKQIKGDDFDFLLDELLVKEQKKNEKKKGIENTSHAHTQKAISPKKQLYQTEQWDSLSKNKPETKIYEPMRNRQPSRSIYDGSEDNKSIMSGKSGVTNQNPPAVIFDGLNTVKQEPQIASTRNMKPPLRRREQSNTHIFREPSIAEDLRNQDNTSFPSIQEMVDVEKGSKIDLNRTQAVKQKTIYIKEDNSKVKEEHEKEIKLIKQSHQRQLKQVKQELAKEIENARSMKLKLQQEFQRQKQRDKKLWEEMSSNNIEKTKQLYEWEIKKKTQTYQIEIEQLKKICELHLNVQKKQSDASSNVFKQKEQLKIQQKQISLKIKKMEELERHLQQKQKSIESHQFDFDRFRKKEEDKMQSERKKLYDLEAELQRRKNQLRKENQNQKINLANDLAKQELEVRRQKEKIKLERDELELEKDLFEKQKVEFEHFNASIIKDCKMKLRELELQKHQYQQKQIQMYKKIHTVELVASAKGINLGPPNSQPQFINKSKPKGKSSQNEPISINQKPEGEKDRDQASPSFLHEYARKSCHSDIMESNTNLKQYLLKMNRDNKRMRPTFL